MLSAISRRSDIARLAFLILFTVVSSFAVGADPPQRTRRVLYNFDGDSCLSTKAGGKGPAPVIVDDVKRLIEEVAYDERPITSVTS